MRYKGRRSSAIRVAVLTTKAMAAATAAMLLAGCDAHKPAVGANTTAQADAKPQTREERQKAREQRREEREQVGAARLGLRAARHLGRFH
jgi:hypothetical protein